MSTVDQPPPAPHAPTGEEFIEMQASPEFQELRRTLRKFVFPLTAFFLIVVLGATDVRAPKGMGALAIGLSLTLIHLISIPISNTSVNPARSTSVASERALQPVSMASSMFASPPTFCW